MGNLGPRRWPTTVPQKPPWASLIFNEQISLTYNTHNFEYLSNINIKWNENDYNKSLNHFPYIIFFLSLFSVLMDNVLLLLLPTSILLPQSTHPEDTHVTHSRGGCHQAASACHQYLNHSVFHWTLFREYQPVFKDSFFLKLWQLYYFYMV